MERAKGKVPTQINKERIAGGSQDFPTKEEWGAFSKKINAQRKAGQSVPVEEKTNSQDKTIEKKLDTIIKTQKKDLEHDKHE